jgi:fatty-acyl-CoA synthase
MVLPIDGLAHVRGRDDAALTTSAIPQLLAATVARFGERPAVVFREQGIRWTWDQFAAEIEALAAGLQALGLTHGDRVGIWSPNRSEWLVTQFATARLGLVLVNINPAYRLAELEYALNASGCRALIAAERLKSSMYLEMLQALAPELAQCTPGQLKARKLPALEAVIRLGEGHTPGMLNYAELLRRGIRAPEVTLDAHEPINIQFTSGTTGHPKGATLSHHNVVNNARFIA